MRLTRLIFVMGVLLIVLPAYGQTFDFSTCGATGANGPTQAACNAAYSSTDLAGAVTIAAGSGVQDWVVPSTGTYVVTAIGAQGGNGANGGGFVGGLGAEIQGTFTFDAGMTLQLVVGQMGVSSVGNGGGGGGSFVVDLSNDPLLVAGGGGGIRASAGQNGTNASITELAFDGSCSSSTYTPVLNTTGAGQGGAAPCESWGSAGAGFYSNGANDIFGPEDVLFGTGGSSWASGMVGGSSNYPCYPVDGGFGGGGSGNGCFGGGGGGGYSGGDGGWIAGGGGSFNSGIDPSALGGVGEGDGSIEIEELSSSPTPEPTSMLLFGTGLVGIGLVMRKRLFA